MDRVTLRFSVLLHCTGSWATPLVSILQALPAPRRTSGTGALSPRVEQAYRRYQRRLKGEGAL